MPENFFDPASEVNVPELFPGIRFEYMTSDKEEEPNRDLM